MFKKLRNRFLALNVLSISAVIIVALIVVYTMSYKSMLSDIDDKLGSTASLHSVVGVGDVDADIESVQFSMVESAQALPAVYDSMMQVMVNDSGSIIGGTPFISESVELTDEDYINLTELALQSSGEETRIEYKGRLWQFQVSKIEVYVGNMDYQLHQQQSLSFLDVTEDYADMRRLLWLLCGVGAGVVVLVFGISMIFANRAISPIMQAWQKQKRFVEDASHELKTPIAIIEADAEAMLSRGQDTVLQQRKWLDYIREQTGRMGSLVESMLQLAGMEGSQLGQAREDVDFSERAAHVLLTMEAMIYEKGLLLQSDIAPGINVAGDAVQLERLVQILLDNAVKYTPLGGGISVALHSAGKKACLAVRNTGAGIPADDLPRLFDRFYRVDQSRVRQGEQASGFGLGLSLAKAVVEGHGGSISCSSVEGEYAEFKVVLPVLG